MSYNSETGMWEGFIYKIVNNVNDKVYIGQTTKNIDKRWEKHLIRFRQGNFNNLAIYFAFDKYGIDNFKVYEVEKVVSQEVESLIEILNDAEIYYISKYDSYHKGYNRTLGGNFSYKTIHLTPIIQYDLDGNFLLKYKHLKDSSTKTGVNQDSIKKCCEYQMISAGGYRWSYINNPPCMDFENVNKRIVQYNLSGEMIKRWDTIIQASSELNIRYELINKVCNGNITYTHDFIFRYFCYDVDKYPIPDLRVVCAYLLDGSFVNEYRSIHMASKLLGVNYNLIKDCCEGKRERSDTYVFCYKGTCPNFSFNETYYRKPIMQYSLDGTFIAEYPSVAETSRITGISEFSIREVIKGRWKKAKGFIFRYKYDNSYIEPKILLEKGA